MFGLIKRNRMLNKRNEELVLENELIKKEAESYKRMWENERETNDELAATIARSKAVKKQFVL